MSAELGTARAPRVTPLSVYPGEARDRWFFTGMAVAALLTVFAGFARSYYLRGFSDAPALPAVVHLHGLVFTGWILLFLSQTTLVAAGRVDLHRRLGLLGALLAVAMLVVGTATAIGLARRGAAPLGAPSPLGFMAVPLGDLVVFGAFVGAALYLRRRPQTHKRLMLLATISLMAPPIARLPFIASGGLPAILASADLFLVACLLYDWRAHGRVHPAFIWGGLLLLVSQPLRLVVAGTDAWLSFAGWLVR